MKRRLMTALIPALTVAGLAVCGAKTTSVTKAPTKVPSTATSRESVAVTAAVLLGSAHASMAHISMAYASTARAALPMEPKPDADALYITRDGKTSVSVVVAADAGPWEKRAAEDLVKYVEMMSGAKLAVVNAPPAGPAIVIGQAALAADASLQGLLNGVVKKNPVVRADGIVMRRTGNRVYLAGSNDESHYFAVSQLLQNWGCRWYLPTKFGEVIPEKKTLWIGKLSMVYAPPFEIRHYWIAWRGSSEGATEFRHRNFMTETSMAGMNHSLAAYTTDIVPPGKSVFNITFSDPKTAEHIAEKIGPRYAAGESISLAIEDGNYSNDSAEDKALITAYDKYMMKPAMTDAMLTLYNNVGKILRAKYPDSKAKIGGLAYANVTTPPKIVQAAEPNVVIWLAPIDIDPIHGMDDPKSAPRQEYRDMMHRWAQVVGGRLAIYDYDQGMLTWRDLPNPSITAFSQDVKHYQKAGILGVGTESRNAIATVFTNLFFRGQLMWNPNADTKAMLSEFYPNFYGPAARPMADYWNSINAAWDNSPVTEHEYFIAPAIYTPQLVSRLRNDLEQATKLIAPLKTRANMTRNEKLYIDRIAFTQNSFDVIKNYMAMLSASASDVDYARAAIFADKGLAARDALGQLNPTFVSLDNEGASAAWWRGEPPFMRELLGYTDGTTGTLIAKTPLEWRFKRGESVPAGWTYTGMEGAAPKGDVTAATQSPTRKNGWQPLRTDIYIQGQGLHNPDGQSYTGHYWYQTTLDLRVNQVSGKPHLMMPGLFNEAWLYINGELVGHRDYNEPWWLTDYKFTWDVDLTGKLKPGKNIIAVRGFNPHHFGGMFRRPFLYQHKAVKR